MTRQSGWAFSARTLVIGPVPAPNSTRARARSQLTLRTVARDNHGLLGARLAMAVPWRKNLPKNRKKSRIDARSGKRPTFVAEVPVVTKIGLAQDFTRATLARCWSLSLRNRAASSPGGRDLSLSWRKRS